MKRLLLIFLLIAVAFSGCTEKQPSAEGPSAETPSSDEIKMLMIDSANDLESYKFSTESTQKVTVFNRSTDDMNASTITVTAVGDGDVDLSGRAMRMVQTMNIESENNNAAPGKSETYILNDTIYMSMDGNWTSLKIPNADLIWDRQNMVRNQAELINNSEIVLLGEELVEGQNTYKLEVIPDMETYSAVLSEQVGSILPVAVLNLSEMYRNSSPKWTSWVTKDSYHLLKNEILMDLTVIPEDIGLRPEEVGDFEMNVNLATTTIFRDFNQPVEIALPEGAKNATVMTLMPASALPPATA
jgi:Family of unknown function (DUF6612)